MNASDRGAIDKAWQENAPLAQARGGQGRTTGMYRAYVFILPRATCLNCILGCWFSVHPVQDKQEVREGTSAGSKVWDRGPEVGICTKRQLACNFGVHTYCEDSSLQKSTWSCLGGFNGC